MVLVITVMMEDRMTDFEKEKIYRESVELLSSSLTNSENMEASLRALESLGDYKDAPELLVKFTKIYEKQLEDNARLDKRRKFSRGLQTLLLGVGFAVVLGLILLLVYGLRNPPWR